MPKEQKFKRARQATSEPLKVKRLFEDAKLPKRHSAKAAGYDLYSYIGITIPAKKYAGIQTGIAITPPFGCYGRIAPRSSLAVKHGLDTMAGVIDRDYTGDVTVVLINHGDVDYQGLCLFFTISKKKDILLYACLF